MAGFPQNPYFQNALARYAGRGAQPMPIMAPQQFQAQIPPGMPARGTAMPVNTNPVMAPGGGGGMPPVSRFPIARGTAMRPTGSPALPTGGMNSLRGYANL